MRREQDRSLAALMERLIESGAEKMAQIFAGLFDLAMRLGRRRFLRAGRYERTPERRGHATGTKPKKIDTPARTVTLQVSRTPAMPSPSIRRPWSTAGAPAAPS